MNNEDYISFRDNIFADEAHADVHQWVCAQSSYPGGPNLYRQYIAILEKPYIGSDGAYPKNDELRQDHHRVKGGLELQDTAAALAATAFLIRAMPGALCGHLKHQAQMDKDGRQRLRSASDPVSKIYEYAQNLQAYSLQIEGVTADIEWYAQRMLEAADARAQGHEIAWEELREDNTALIENIRLIQQQLNAFPPVPEAEAGTCLPQVKMINRFYYETLAPHLQALGREMIELSGDIRMGTVNHTPMDKLPAQMVEKFVHHGMTGPKPPVNDRGADS